MTKIRIWFLKRKRKRLHHELSENLRAKFQSDIALQNERLNLESRIDRIDGLFAKEKSNEYT